MTTNAATNALHLQLIAMAQRGERPRCADPITHNLWTSDDQRDRTIAALWCAPAVRWPTRLNEALSGIGLAPIPEPDCAFNPRFPRLLRYQPMVRSLCLDTRYNARRLCSALVSRRSRDASTCGVGVDTATAWPRSAVHTGEEGPKHRG
jgi:hypothetical protein